MGNFLFGLSTLETRRLRGDQIEVFNILNGYENIDRNICSRSRKSSSMMLLEVATGSLFACVLLARRSNKSLHFVKMCKFIGFAFS